eukprot:scaffold973_cov399-Prasinococcus_capsulatus_cf.AAC.25
MMQESRQRRAALQARADRLRWRRKRFTSTWSVRGSGTPLSDALVHYTPDGNRPLTRVAQHENSPSVSNEDGLSSSTVVVSSVSNDTESPVLVSAFERDESGELEVSSAEVQDPDDWQLVEGGSPKEEVFYPLAQAAQDEIRGDERKPEQGSSTKDISEDEELPLRRSWLEAESEIKQAVDDEEMVMEEREDYLAAMAAKSVRAIKEFTQCKVPARCLP